MPSLSFYVSATEGRYGVKNPQDLTNNQTFGSQGATVCVILLLTKSDGNLFCGHMACNMSGIPANEQTIKTRTGQLLDAALGADEKAQAWTITGSSTDTTNQWIRAAMTTWFTHAPTANSNNSNDGYFLKENGNITLTLSSDMNETDATEVNTGNFCIQP